MTRNGPNSQTGCMANCKHKMNFEINIFHLNYDSNTIEIVNITIPKHIVASESFDLIVCTRMCDVIATVADMPHCMTADPWPFYTSLAVPHVVTNTAFVSHVTQFWPKALTSLEMLLTTQCNISPHAYINTLRPRQNGRHSPDNIFNCIFLNENV